MSPSTTPEPGQDWLQRNLFWVSRTSWPSYVLIATSLIAVVATYLVLTGSTPIDASPEVRLYLTVVDALLLLALVALVIGRLVQLWIGRRSGSAGARLHGRLVTIFSLIAVIPVVLTAGAAAITINLAMEAWFSGGVRNAIDNSLAIADSYLEEHKNVIRADTLAMAKDFQGVFGPFTTETNTARFEQFLERQAGIRSLPGAAIFNASNAKIAEVRFLVLSVDAPTQGEIAQASAGEAALTTDADDGLVRAVVKLDPLGTLFLVTVRSVNEQVLAYQQNTRNVVKNYNRLENDRDSVQLTFVLMYGIIAFLILFAAIWVGLGVANRIVTPIGRLIGAAERVSEGDLAARVTLADDDDELASLGRAFNRMTAQLQSQRNELVESNRQAEQRRIFTETVLSGVSAGVIGLDTHGHADVVNRSALHLLSMGREELIGRDLRVAVPEVETLVADAMKAPEGRFGGQIDVTRNGKTRNLSVTVTRERASADERGYVVTFDDVTDLIMAQRTSAWADVARRIAHEIKNPLTPIQLSAERLRRKYKKEIATDPEVFEQCTQTIIRQVGDIGRMVDEFSSFARMPQPVMHEEDICELIKHSAFLQRVANPQITYALLTPDEPVIVECDGRLVSQALTNVLKNAGEAVRARFGIEGQEEQLSEGGRIELRLVQDAARVAIEVIDNGIGLPKEDRNRLTEPYVTKRAKGTGLGLAIVKKIMEDHKGTLALEDAPKIDETGATREGGAMVRLTFPRHIGAMKLAGE